MKILYPDSISGYPDSISETCLFRIPLPGKFPIFTALLLRENHDFPSSGFQNKTSFLFETRQPRTHVRVLGWERQRTSGYGSPQRSVEQRKYAPYFVETIFFNVAVHWLWTPLCSSFPVSHGSALRTPDCGVGDYPHVFLNQVIRDLCLGESCDWTSSHTVEAEFFDVFYACSFQALSKLIPSCLVRDCCTLFYETWEEEVFVFLHLLCLKSENLYLFPFDYYVKWKERLAVSAVSAKETIVFHLL